jgi:hypothetical protein
LYSLGTQSNSFFRSINQRSLAISSGLLPMAYVMSNRYVDSKLGCQGYFLFKIWAQFY